METGHWEEGNVAGTGERRCFQHAITKVVPTRLEKAQRAIDTQKCEPANVPDVTMPGRKTGCAQCTRAIIVAITRDAVATNAMEGTASAMPRSRGWRSRNLERFAVRKDAIILVRTMENAKGKMAHWIYYCFALSLQASFDTNIVNRHRHGARVRFCSVEGCEARAKTGGFAPVCIRCVLQNIHIAHRCTPSLDFSNSGVFFSTAHTQAWRQGEEETLHPP